MTAGPEAPAYADPTHQLSERPTLWTRVNTAEATPGVVTPLHWDFYRAAESGIRASAYDRGIYDEAEVPFPGVVDDNWTGAFYGRVALSVDALREVYDRVPGTSADEFELNMFGSVRADAHGHPTSRYHERILGRRDALLQQIPAVVLDLHDEYAAWWRNAVSAEVLGDFDGTPARWIEARERLERIMRPHTIASNFAMEGFAALARSCAEVDRLDLLTALAGGYGDTEDDRLATALWETAHGERSRASLIEEYGFHGDAAGDLFSTVWHEETTRLVALLDALASMDTNSGPAATASERRAEREQAEQALLAAVPRAHRAGVERSMAETRHFTALRQLGKVTFWRATDAGRAATRTIGTGLVRAGLLDDRDDVYFLLASELVPDLVPDAATGWPTGVPATPSTSASRSR